MEMQKLSLLVDAGVQVHVTSGDDNSVKMIAAPQVDTLCARPCVWTHCAPGPVLMRTA